MLELIKKWWPFHTFHRNAYEKAVVGEISWEQALRHGPAESYRVPQIRERCQKALKRGEEKANINHPIRSVTEERNVYKKCLKDIIKRT